jgi:hypothetical protein
MNVLRPSRARFVIALLLPVLAFVAMAAPAVAQDDFYTLPIPCRYDSRVPSSVPPGPFGAGGPPHVVPLSSFLGCTIPANATALAVSVVGINPSANGELIVFPDAMPSIEPVIPGHPPVARIPGSLPMEQGKNKAKIFFVEVGPGPAIRFIGNFLIEAGFHVEINVLGYFLNPTLDLDTDNSAGVRPNFVTNFVEGGGPVRITDDVTVADSDDTELEHVTITLTNRPDGAAEILAANVGSTGIVASYTSATGVLLLQGPATLADFDTVLETVTYDNTATTPNLTTRVITFVSNDGDGDGSSVTTSVTLNDLPTISAIADQVIDEDTSTGPLSFTVGDVSTPVASLTVTATSSDQSIIPDANLVLGGTNPNRTITVTPLANAFGGPVTITVSVSDGISTTNETFTVTVNAINDAPTITAIADQSIAEDASTGPLAFTIGDLETAPGSLTVTATSSDQTLIPDANVVLGGSGANRTVTVTPAADQTGGPATITVSVSDGTDSTPETFTVTVGASDDGPTITAIADQVIDEDTSTGPLAFTVGDVDTAVGSLTVTATSSDQTLIPNANVVLGGVNPNRTVTVTPAANQTGGPVTITVSVSDGTTTTNETFTVTVSALNDAPTVSAIGDQVIDEDTSTGPLAFTVGDVETAVGSLTVTATSSDQTLIPDANVVLGGVNPNRTVTVTPAANQSGGPVTITVSVGDGTNTTTETFTVTVSAVDDPPTISDVANLAIDEDTSTGPLAVTVGDPDTAVGSLTLTGTSSDQTLIPNANIVVGGSGANRTVTVTPAPNQFGGPVTITLTVSDGSGSAVDTFTITINAVNDAPTVTAIGDQVIDEDTSTAPLAFTIGDLETPVASLTVTASSSDTTLIPNANVVIGGAGASRTVTVTPAANQFGGPVTITISVGDGTNTTIETFTVTVNNVNDLPTITAIGDVTIDEDTSTNSLAFTIDDIETAAASLTVTGTSSNVTIIPNAGIVIGGSGASRTVTVTPAPNQFGGPVTITISVSDGTNTTQETFTVTVNAVNDAPTVTPIGNQTIDEDTSTGPLAFTVGDVETAAGSLTVTASSDSPTLIPNANVVIGGSGASRTVTVTPAPNQFGGPATITITVNDGSGQPNSIVTTTFTVTVNSIPDPPVAGTDNFETFGNTELRVDLAAAATPHVLTDLTGASGVLNNDSDPIEMTPISITNVVGCGDVTAPFVCATASGGQVTLESDGSFSYLPPQANPAVLATDSSDSFQYTLTNGVGASAIGTVNLTRREVIWYVDPTAAAGGDGRSHNPFQSFASLNGVAGSGDLDNADDYILVHDGTFPGNASIELEAGQRLIGQGVGLSLPLGSQGTKEILPATTHPQITNASGDVIRVTSAVPARIAGLSLSGSVNAIDMPATGAYTGSGTLTIENNIFRGAGAEGIDINAGATGTLALNVQNNSWSAAGTHVGNAVDVAATNGALQLNISNNSGVLSTGASAIVAGAVAPGVLTVTGFAGNSIHGNSALAGISINQATFDSNVGSGGFQQVDGDTLAIGALGNPVGGVGLALTSVQGNLFFDNLYIFAASTSGTGLQVSGTGGGMAFSVTPASPDGSGMSSIDADNGPAVDLSNVALDLRLDDLESTTTTSGVVLSSVSGQFRAPSSSLVTKSSGGGTAFSVSSSSASVSYAGSLNVTSGAGVALSGNTGSTSFSGGMLLSTGTNTAFSATGGGTVTVTDPPGLTNNTITTTTGTAVNISGTSIGGSGVTFESVSSTTAGSNTAIILANTGSGSFLITGTGSSGTGGTISNKSVDAMTMNNTDGSVTLRNMIIQDIGDLGGGLNTISGDDGIHAQQVDGGLTLENVTIRRISDQAIHGALFAGGATVWNGLTITNSTIEDTNRFNVANVGDANNEGMIRILGIRGNVSITGSTLQRGGELVDFFVTDGTLNMTASTNNFHTAYKEFTSGATASVGGHCVDVTVQGAANANVRVGDRSDGSLANNFLNCRLGSVRVANDSGATGSIDVVIGRNAFTVNDHSSGFGGDFDFPQGGVLVMSRGTDAATFDVVIDGNYFDEITNASGGVGQVSYDMQNGNWQVLMEDNTFDTPGNAPWFLRADSTASARVLFRNNVGIKGFFTCPDASCAGGYNGPGLRSLADLQNGALLDLTIVGDQFAEHDASFDPGQTFEARTLNTGGGGTLCLDLQNNQAPDGYSLEEFAGDLNLVGSGSCPAGTPSASCQTLLGAKGNLGGSNVATTSPPFVNVSGTIDVVASACQQPAGSIF